MNQKRKDELYFENLGDHFDDWMSTYDVAQRIKLIKKFLPAQTKSMSCLEIGCGTGKISQELAIMVKELTVSDISEKMAKNVGRRLGVQWSQQNACDLQIADASYDLVISSECIEHTPDPVVAISEAARVTKPGGSVIITSPNKLWYPVLWLSTITKLRNFQGNEVWLFPWQASDVLSKQGFTELDTSGCHLFPWQIPLANRILPTLDKMGPILYPVMINYGIYGKKHRMQVDQ